MEPFEDSLGVDELALWCVMVSDRRVLVPSDQVEARSGLDRSAFDMATGNLIASGLVEVCAWGDDAQLTFTPFAASRLGLKCRRARGEGSGPRSLVWIAHNAPDRREVARPVVLSDEASAFVAETAADREPIQPPEVAEAIEAAAVLLSAPAPKRRTEEQRNPNNLPRPSIVLTGVQPWPPEKQWGAVCPVCRRSKSGRVGSSVYCLACDKWGLDHVLAKLVKAAALIAVPIVAKFRARRSKRKAG